MRRRGGGSLYQRKDGRWVFQREVAGARTYGYGHTPEQAVARCGKPRPKKPVDVHAILRKRDRSHDQELAAMRRDVARRSAALVLEAAAREGWETIYTAAVIAAQLSVGRLRHGVVGPCVYCGTWLANSVDHIIPRSAGGTDEAPNLASACFACNASKRARSIEEWRRSA